MIFLRSAILPGRAYDVLDIGSLLSFRPPLPQRRESTSRVPKVRVTALPRPPLITGFLSHPLDIFRHSHLWRSPLFSPLFNQLIDLDRVLHPLNLSSFFFSHLQFFLFSLVFSTPLFNDSPLFHVTYVAIAPPFVFPSATSRPLVRQTPPRIVSCRPFPPPNLHVIRLLPFRTFFSYSSLRFDPLKRGRPGL